MKRVSTFLSLFVTLTLLTATGLQAQLSGTYTINSGAATGGTNYASFTDAVTALTTSGVSGPVTFNVVAASGPYTNQITIGSIVGASAANTITFNGNGETIQFSAGSSARHVIWLNGADHIIFNNLVIKSLNSTYGWGIRFSNAADSNKVSNCTVDVSATTSTSSSNSWGILFTSSATSYSGSGNNGNYNEISNNTIKGGYGCITVYGASSTGMGSDGNMFINNIIQDFYYYGMRLYYPKSTIIRSNDISRPTRTSVSTFYGIYYYYGGSNCIIEKNRIHNPNDGNPSYAGSCYGINFSYSDATSGSENYVQNNAIYNFTQDGSQYGIYCYGSDYTRIYHNSVNLDYANSTSSSVSYGMYFGTTSATGVEFRNNLVNITRNNSGTKYLIYCSSSNLSASNNNAWYLNATSGTNYFGYWSGAQATFALWQSNTSQDAASVEADPAFVNASAGDLTPSSFFVNDIGAPLGVVDDILGTSRSATTPDPGAFEFSPPVNDAGVSAFIAPAPPVFGGSQNVIVEVSNFGANNISTATINWTINGVGQTPFAFAGPAIVPGGTANVTIGSTTLTGGITYDLKAWTTAPNGTTDPNNNNDTSSTSVCVSVNGTYTINSAQATGGTNFNSFNDAITQMVNCGISGPVILNVVAGSGPYTEQVIFPFIPGSSAINTITINGNGDTLQHTPTSSDKRVLGFSGAKHITVNNLYIRSLGTYGYGVHFSNGADSNKVNMCTIDVLAGTQTSSTYTTAVAFSSSATSSTSSGNNGNYNTISNNTIRGGYYCISMYGTSTTMKGMGNSITGNTIEEYYYYGVRTYYIDMVTIHNNIINRSAGGVTSSYGIYCGYTDRFSITSNCILKAGRYGIYMYYGNYQGSGSPTSSALIANNMISGFDYTSTSYGMYITTNARRINVYYNSVSLTNTYSSVYGMYVASGTGTNIVNNSFATFNASSGYALYVSSTSYVDTVNYNNYYTASSSNFIYIGGAYSTGTYVGGGGFNVNSRDGDPNYLDNDLDLHAQFFQLNSFATPIPGITVDKDGDTRDPLTPDIGADEYTVPPNDAGISAIPTPMAPFSSGNQTVGATIANYGSNTLLNANVDWTVNGVGQTPVLFNGSLAPGASTGLTLGTYNFPAGQMVNVTSWTSLPNGFVDGNFNNDTTTRIMCSALAGTYTINSAAATGGTNFNSFTDAVNAMITCGISAAVTFNVVAGSGPYTEQITLPLIAGSSATNTITFNGNGDTLQALTNSANRFVWLFDGGKHVTINNLYMMSLDATYGYGIIFTNTADSNTINGCTIDVLAGTQTSTTYTIGIMASGSTTSYSTTGNNANYLTLTNNTIKGGYTSVSIYGGGTSAKTMGHVISGNTLEEFYYYGIFSYYQDTIIVHNNIIRASNTTTTGYGIYSYYNDRFAYTSNCMYNLGNYGIRLYYGNYQGSGSPASRALISNNMIGSFKYTSTTYGMYITTNGRDVDIVNNSVSLNNSISSGYGLYMNSGSGINVMNNSFAVFNSSSAYAMYISSTSYVDSVNWNNYYAPGSSNFIYLGGAYSSATYVGGGGFNTNSKDGNPNYLDPDMDLHAILLQLNNSAKPLANVPLDKDGDTRSLTTPDIGADEYTPPNNDMAVIQVLQPNSGQCGDSSTTVEVVIGNYGINTQSNVTVGVTLAGAGSGSASTVYAGPIAAGQTDTVVIGNVVTYAGGVIDFITYTMLSGDQVPGNDTLIHQADITGVPAPPASVADSGCVGDILTLTASGYNFIRWYDAPSGGNLLATNDTFVTPALSSTTTYWVEGQALTTTSLTTTYAGGNGCGEGNMFDLKALSGNITLTSIDCTPTNSGTQTMYVYYLPGGYATSSGPSGWISLDTLIVNVPTAGSPFNLDITDLTIPVGQTYGIYVRYNARYTSGANTFSDGNLEFVAGNGNCSAFDYCCSPRTFNGAFYYLVAGCIGERGPVEAFISQPVADAGADQAMCLGASTTIGGSPVAVAGVAPFTYSWSPATGLSSATAANPTATPSATTTYSVTITDALGCTASDDMTVTIWPLPVANAGINDTLCAGQSTSIGGSPSASGGTPGYTYSWAPAGSLSSATVANPTATPSVTTEYTLTVTDANGCTDQSTVSVIVSMPVADAGADPGICFGSSATIGGSPTASGFGPFTYAWSPATNLSATNVANPVASPSSTETYVVVITDRFGCTDSDTVSVIVNPFLDPDAGQDVNICYGTSTVIGGSPTILGGTPPYTYSWTPTTGLSSPSVANPTASPTVTTEYIVDVIDATGCSGQDTVVVSVWTLPTADAGSAFDVCWGSSVTIGGNPTASGTVGPYTYSWAPAATLSATNIANPDANPLVNTTYTVTVTDGNGCVNYATAVVTVLPLPDATITPAGPFCLNDAAATLTAATSGGSWYGNGITNPSAGTFDPGTAGVGTHEIIYIVTDNNNCTNSDTIDIVVNPLPDPSIIDPGPLCINHGAFNLGSATSGGTWSGNGILNSATGLYYPPIAGIGAHTVSYSVTNQFGCTTSSSIIINVYPQPNATINPAGPFCANDAAVNLSAGYPGGTWSGVGITNSSAGTFDPVVAGPGSHIITYAVTDSNGCENGDLMVITVNPLPTVNIAAVGPLCLNASPVNMSASWSGGSWSGTGITNSSAGTFDASVAGAGTHTVYYTVSNQYGCTTTVSEDVTVLPLPNASITPVGPFCSNDAALTLTPVANIGGTWSGTGIINAVTGVFDPAIAGGGIHTVYYTFTDVNGCTNTGMLNITVYAKPNTAVLPAGPFCVNDTLVYLTGVPTYYPHAWSGPGIVDATLGGFNPKAAGVGNHTVYYSVTNPNGCTEIGSAVITVNGGPDAVIHDPGPFCENGPMVNLSANTGGGTWSGPGIVHPQLGTFYPYAAGAGLHIIHYIAYNAAGCYDEDTILIEVYDVPELSVNIIDASCDVSNDGAIDLTITGGTTPYVINWSNGTVNEDLDFVMNGSYTITVTDFNGCTVSETYAVGITSTIQVTANIIPATSSIYTNGSIDITVVGGTPPYTYMWSNGMSTEDIDRLAGGTYGLTILDAAGCRYFFYFDVPNTFGVGIDPADLANNISLFPNPTDGIVNINIEAGVAADLQMTVYDILGRKVHEHFDKINGSYTHALDMKEWSSGHYMIKFDIDGNIVTKKVVLNK